MPISPHKFGVPNVNHSPYQWPFNQSFLTIRIKGVKWSRSKRFKLNCIFKSTIEYQPMALPSLFVEHHSWFWRPPSIILVHFDAAKVLNLFRTLQQWGLLNGASLLNDLIWDLLMKVSASQMGCITLRLQALENPKSHCCISSPRLSNSTPNPTHSKEAEQDIVDKSGWSYPMKMTQHIVMQLCH